MSDELPGSPPPPSAAPELDPRLRGPQASPAPAKAPIPIAPIVLGAGVLLTVGILVFNRGGDEAPEPEAPTGPPAVAANDTQPPPLVGGDRPEIKHAEAWEKSAEALGEIDKHLHRAKLIFGDIDATGAGGGAGGGNSRELKWRGGGGFQPPGGGPPNGGAPPNGGPPGGPPDGAPPDGAPPGADAPPPPIQPAGPTPEQIEAQRLWNDWASNWATDLEVITGMLPAPETVDNKLLPGYSAVAELIGMCRRLPSGNPPGKAARDQWLRGLQDKSAAARATLESAR